jgi:hypothetical protein
MQVAVVVEALVQSGSGGLRAAVELASVSGIGWRLETANTGGGGVELAFWHISGGAGGSGIVILKYLVPVGTTVTHIYKGSGSWVAPTGVTAVDYLVVAGGGGGGIRSVVVAVLVGYRTAHGFAVTAGTTTQLRLVLAGVVKLDARGGKAAGHQLRCAIVESQVVRD